MKTKTHKHEALVRRIQSAVLLAKLLGLFNLRYSNAEGKYTVNRFLTQLNKYMLWFCIFTFPIFVLVLVVLTIVLKMFYKDDKKHKIQDSILQGLNMFQLWFGILMVYLNQSLHYKTLRHIWNRVLKCNRICDRLMYRTAIRIRKINFFSAFRLCATIVEIYLAYKRINLKWVEIGIVLIPNRIVMSALFFQWELIQNHLTAIVSKLNEFVNDKAENIEAIEYEVMAKITAKIYKLQKASNRYFSVFMSMAYLNIFRLVLLCYHTFAPIIFNGFEEGLNVCPFSVLFMKTICPLSMLVVDVLMLGHIAENLSQESNRLHWNIVEKCCKRNTEPDIQNAVDAILGYAHLVDLIVVDICGGKVSRKTSVGMICEAISWTIVCLMYTAGDPDGKTIFGENCYKLADIDDVV